MSFYRTVLAAIAAVAIAAPVFADDTTSTTGTTDNTTATQSSDTSGSSATTQSTGDQSSSTSTETKVNLNKATAKELMKVGFTASQARAIISYRNKHKKEGGFKSVDELAKIKSLKKMKSEKLQTIEDQVTVD